MRKSETEIENMTKKQETGALHATGDMLTAHLLAMLKGWSAYGYDLAQRLTDEGLGEYNKGTIYRTLRQMEKLGLVSSMWDTSADGPARRMYSLTQAGSLFLTNWIAIIEMHRNGLERFLSLTDRKTKTENKPAANEDKSSPRSSKSNSK